MSDKSFGDHVNRNIVKNSLLSSAVIGLSLEDLTHKAVLLPATPTQGQVTRLDQAQGSQPRTLMQADHDKPSFPSGDAFSNISLSNTPSNTLPNKSDSEINEKIKSPATATQSKASVKPEDDFDVNEYIARLQGTRYVSAPLHSNLKEEQKTNLEAEESLEEINLNESGNEPVQQSLTADIAQNFSQLPTVLPHVASAVFSSFSNMLSMKSKEQTPDDTKSGYQEVLERSEAGVPLMGVEEAPKDFGLPPKELPVTGISSYRINSKKKYAQIPGLSYGGAAQNIYLNPNPLATGQLPPIMTPEGGLASSEVVTHGTVAPIGQNIQFSAPEFKNDSVIETVEETSGIAYINKAQFTANINVFNPAVKETPSGTPDSNIVAPDNNAESAYNIKENTNESQSISVTKESQPNLFTPIDHKDIITPRIPIIPPPPMFSNLTRSGQTAVGKSVLPPSVARRISANQPLIKQPMPTPTFTDNIFVPTIPQTSDPIPKSGTLPPSLTPDLTIKPPVMQPQFYSPSVPVTSQTDFVQLFTPSEKPVSSSVRAPFFTSSAAETIQPSTIGGQSFIPSPEKSQSSTIEVSFFTPSNTEVSQAFGMSGRKDPLPATAATDLPSSAASSIFGAGSLPPSYIESEPNAISSASVSTKNIPLSSVPAPSSNVASPFVPMFPSTSKMLPPFFNPTQPPTDTQHLITQTPLGVTPEPVKPLVEPPKATGTVNFRMTKKRPQYYSGPIEGVGDISNNVKPIIAPVIPPVPAVDANAYPASLFTPKQQPQTVENYTAPNEQSTVPFDINKPVEPPPYAPFEAKSQPFAPFDINRSQHNYAQEYNTAFDLSRQTTEEYDPPKEEPKGFGIIGSLKSKLSSIDINKIQSTVTTFFDPAYNDAKGEPALETAPYSQQQHGQYSHEQSSFEIMVPSVEPNQYSQFRHKQEHSYDQNYQYYQAQNAYNYASNEGQRVSSHFTETSYSSHFDTALHTNTHESRALINYTQENIPQNIENISSHNAGQEQKELTYYGPATTQEPAQSKTESITNYPQESATEFTTPFVSPNVGSHGAIGDFAIKTSVNQDYKPLIDPVVKAPSFFGSSLVGELKVKTHDNAAFNATKNAQSDSAHSKTHFSAPLPPAINFFDSPISGAQESKQKTVDLVDEMEKLALAEEIAIASSPFQAIDLQLGTNTESKVIETSSILLKAVGQTAITTIALDKNVQNYPINKEVNHGTDQKGISLMESLSKDTTPVVAVSSVPLFGLSAMIADKTQEFSSVEKDFQKVCLLDGPKETKHLEKQSFSFFENIAAENKLREEPVKAPIGLSISDVKNVFLIEPPQEEMGTILPRKAISSLQNDLPEADFKSDHHFSGDRDSSWNLDAAMVTSKANVNVLFDRKASGFFDHVTLLENPVGGIVMGKDNDATEQASDFNICETCREVNTPGKETDNVTNQLIENINSSITFSNPVEITLTESNPMADRACEDEQFSEIDRITKDTMETIQGQSATDLSESVATSSDNSNYGWNTEHLAYASLAAIDQDFVPNTGTDASSFNFNSDDTYNTAIDPEFTFKVDPNTIGFFGDNSQFFDNVPKNASDELKAEFKTHEDIVLPRQMSEPSAPPAEEDDSKSDETGLDVLLIEQDAKKDFPLEEEFIIEPSETDDDKLEFRERKRSSEDSMHDTFADRIEKFKNKSGVEFVTNDNSVHQKPAETVPPKSMASYFDTGNYAAEAHYRNSLTSPTINTYPDQIPTNTTVQEQLTTNKDVYNEKTDPFEEGMGRFVPDEAFRLPPGFEDELRRQYKEQQTKPDTNKELFIPETSTQTRTTTTATFELAGSHEYYAIAGSKADNNIIKCGDIRGRDTISTIEQSECNTKPAKQDSYETPSLAKAFDSTNLVIKDHTKVLSAQTETKELTTKAIDLDNVQKDVPLPDPINFFSTETEEPKATTDPPESFSRLASYFSMPPAQPDHSKSFFELSQSQNHYRHVTNHSTKPEIDQNFHQGQVDKITQANIQNLMHDLTATPNISVDEIVRTVNYFSVEYDNSETSTSKLGTANLKTNTSDVKILEGNNLDSLKLNGQKTEDVIDGDVIASSINNSNVKAENGSDLNTKVNTVINTIKTCKYCCNTNLMDVKNYKFRTVADSDTIKESEGTMTNENTDPRKSVSVDFGNCTMDKDVPDEVTQVIHENRSSSEYQPVKHHWFYRVDVDDKSVWRGFSMTDSNALEHAYLSQDLSEDTLIPTDGGRFDVNVIGRLRIAVYWKEKPTNVRRCSWFYKGTTDARYVPYTEAVADKLEEEYRHGVTTGEWHRRLVLPNSELVVMHGPAVMVHFLHGGCSDTFSSPPFLLGKKVYRNPPKIRVARDLVPNVDHLILVVHGAGEYKRNMLEDQSTSRPRVVRRGCEESEIEDPEPSSIDHLLLLCHGVGSACDMRFRSVEEVVEDFRATSLQLLQSHYRNSCDNGIVSRVEVLPISWHAQLHVGEDGVDKRLNKVTLDSIPRLRAFTNHTVLDALFYTSPVYHQTIIETVCFELNRIYSLFKQRNPSFKGGVSLGGHSLGSVILYDLLCHQKPEVPPHPKSSAYKTYLPGTTQPLAKYPQLQFPPSALYALGSPIAIFECIRGVEALGMDFALPTCKNFFNIFHPYDPIAYRIEPLINPLLQDAKPYLIPHHKGRKRMHLELKDTMVRVGADLKQKLVESLRTTWNKWKASPPPDGQLEKVVEEEMEKEQLCNEAKEEIPNVELTTPEMLGRLNDGRRIDYVLQEAPLEMINEYLFAMSSHVGYWESEDTMLLMLREIYSSLGVQPDCTVPQQSMTVTRTTRLDEATIVNEKEYPSTSRGSMC